MVIKCCGSAFTFFQLLFFSFFCVVYLLYLLFHHLSSGCFTLYDIMHDQFFVYMYYCIITKDWDLLHISSAVWKDFKKPGSGREHTVLTNYQKFSNFQSSPLSKAATFNDDFPTLCTACPNMFGISWMQYSEAQKFANKDYKFYEKMYSAPKNCFLSLFSWTAKLKMAF